jgi:hypothetical protein
MKIKVRVNPKSRAESFYRCGIRFAAEWQEVEVDEATAQRMCEEQMLEVDLEDAPPADTLVSAGSGGDQSSAIQQFAEAEAGNQAAQEAAAEAAPAPAPAAPSKPKAAPKPKAPAKK